MAEVLLLCLLAVLAGAETIADIADIARHIATFGIGQNHVGRAVLALAVLIYSSAICGFVWNAILCGNLGLLGLFGIFCPTVREIQTLGDR
ncbi:hypothetical protein EH240_14775 [Mesorhizobium tamadayense]|uniref:Uncharacterized protein n=1 Tax=Mesorhizobium tamadayense TaxID=425306 RepID=A0A3P3FSG0_9HYPH|nr:hypothetical protein [Mesorhizobium tamadayense]RRI01546.1 hypothetical protein EH240_14775 [Mesorhizobium tamadayense]